MSNLHKTPEMLALEEQYRKQAQREHRGASQAAAPRSGARDVPGEPAPADFASVNDLRVPTLPAAAAMLIDMCSDLNVSYRNLANIIQTDPGLSVRILRIANSAYYAQSTAVSSIMRALTVLGLKQVRTLGLSYKLMSVIKEFADDDFDFESYWEKSLLMAVMAKQFARQLRSPLADEAFLAGLLQDIGIIILRYNRAEEYRKIADVSAASPDMPLLRLEQELFGTNHARVGADVCQAWKFPPILTEAIRRHHTPPTGPHHGDPHRELHAASFAASLMPDFLLGNQALQIIEVLESHDIVPADSLGTIFTQANKSFEALFTLFTTHRTSNRQIAKLMTEAADRLKRIGDAQLNLCQPPE